MAGGKPVGDADWNGPLETKPHVLAYDPLTGEVRGKIPLWDGSEIGRKFNGLDQPNGLGVDSRGNLYVGDIPNSNPDPDPTAPPPVPPAVYRIPVDTLDALAAEESGAADAVQRIVMPGYVNGVTISPVDDTCWAVSCNPITDPVKGGIYHLTPADFDSGVQPEPTWRDLGAMDGLGVTRRGTVIADNPLWGIIHAFTADGRHLILEGDGWPVRMPADCNVCYPKFLGGDEPALLVPDIHVAGEPGQGIIGVLDLTGL